MTPNTCSCAEIFICFSPGEIKAFDNETIALQFANHGVAAAKLTPGISRTSHSGRADSQLCGLGVIRPNGSRVRSPDVGRLGGTNRSRPCNRRSPRQRFYGIFPDVL
jgi:hypothetical protein